MSTAPIPLVPAQSAGTLSTILEYFNTYAVAQVNAIGQEQTAISQGDHVAAVNIAVADAGTTLATAMPAMAPNIQVAFQLFAVSEAIVTKLVALFHKNKAKAATTVAAVGAA